MLEGLIPSEVLKDYKKIKSKYNIYQFERSVVAFHFQGLA